MPDFWLMRYGNCGVEGESSILVRRLDELQNTFMRSCFWDACQDDGTALESGPD
jgi:hypothetical protein